MQILRVVGKYPEATVSLFSGTSFDSTHPLENVFDLNSDTFARSLNDLINPYPVAYMNLGLISTELDYYTFDFIYVHNTNCTWLRANTVLGGDIIPTYTYSTGDRSQNALWNFATPQIQQYLSVRGAETYTGGDRRGTFNEVYFLKKLSSEELYVDDIAVDQTYIQTVHTLKNNSKYLITTGSTGWKITFRYRAHMADDVAMLDTLYSSDEVFYLWLNGSNDAVIKQKISPWKIEDLLPVRVNKNRNPSFHKNLIFSGFDDTIEFISAEEVL